MFQADVKEGGIDTNRGKNLRQTFNDRGIVINGKENQKILGRQSRSKEEEIHIIKKGKPENFRQTVKGWEILYR